MKNILITGANGQLGNCLRDLAKDFQDQYNFYYTDVAELDITDAEAIEQFVVGNGIDTIINAAAYTAVDKAEDEVNLAYCLNRDAVRNLADVARNHDCLLVHVSTDYIFSGESCKPYVETDLPAPQSVYGASKLAGEQAIMESGCRAVVIRTSWLYSEYGNNFVKTMLRLGTERESVNVVSDQIGGPTYAGDLAKVIFRLIEVAPTEVKVGIYHFANEGVCSWYDFAKAIMEFGGKKCVVNPIFTSEYPSKARRPSFSVFNLRKTKTTTEMDIPYWRDSLRLIINKL